MAPTLRCVCETHRVLHAVELAPGLPAHECADCHGTLLGLNDYRRWADGQPDVAPVSAEAPLPEATLDAGARQCPSCTRLMERLRVSRQPDFRVDRCAICQWVWLDQGEWAALARAGLCTQLGEVLSDGWQRQLREEASRGRREAELRTRHGDDCIDELNRIRAWLATQPQRDTLLALLRTGW
jgi:Zn-finger nucleic acid-binding protein